MVDVAPRGYFIGCPHCEQELRIAAKYVGQLVGCRFCESQFQVNLANPAIRRVAVYADCPRCGKELRAAVKYLGKPVGCKSCSAPLRFVERQAGAPAS